jgi:excisionase family DNA binding protein
MTPRALGHEILTVREVSELLKIHQGTVYRLAKEGRIPAFRIGTDWRFRTELVVRWMAEQIKSAAQ